MQIQKFPPVEQTRMEIILEIWKLVNDRYPLFCERGIDWNGIKLKYLRDIKMISSYNNLFKYIDQMLVELKDPHTRIVSSPWFQKLIYPLVLVNIGNNLYIQFALNANSKLVAGMKIVKVNGIPIEIIRDDIYSRFPFVSESMREVTLINELMSGDFGEAIEITASDGYKFVTESITKQDVRAIGQQSAEKEAPFTTRVSSCVAKTFGDIGYIKIFAFKHKDITQNFLETLNECGDISSLIIDVRDNIGGLIKETINVTSLFLAEERTLGYRVNKKGDREKILVKPLPGIHQNLRNLIILCNEFTLSSAEFIFIKGLKGSSNKIKVVGNRTAGLVHEATIFPLFDGTRLQITTYKYLTVNGIVREESGIEPDIKVLNSVNFLTKQQDNQFNYAIKLCSN